MTTLKVKNAISGSQTEMPENQTSEILIEVSENQPSLRIDKYLAGKLPGASRSYHQLLIQHGLVSRAGKTVKASEKIEPGDKISVILQARPQPDVQPENIPLDIIFEDESLVVINKPAGMVVHPAVGHWSGTLVNALVYHYRKKLSTLSGETRPGIVHRLDKDTSGLLVVAKNDVVHAALSKQFSKKTARRVYRAVVWGIPKLPKQTIESYIARHGRDRKKMMASEQDGKWAVTHMQLVETFASVASLCEFKLETGRTHQIRVHSASVGHPVFGDPTYGGRRHGLNGINQKNAGIVAGILRDFKRQALHARELSFVHPALQKEVHFQTELPEDMQALITRLRNL